MTLYAVHHAWIDGHAVKAPVGIWGEGGVSFYPAETEDHRKGGSQAESEASQVAWADWVEKRVEWGSTYGASWSAVESDEPMAVVLAELRDEFFSEPHPTKTFYLPPDNDDQSEQDSEGLEEDSDSAQEDFKRSEQSEPAQRFVVAQSWWFASELVRRHPELIVHEMHPGDGQYDVLAVFAPPHDAVRMSVMLNRSGTVQVHIKDALRATPEFLVVSSWAEALGAQNAHAVVKQIEDAAQLVSTTKAPASMPRTLAYRFIAAALTMTVNDRCEWDARNEFIDSSGNYGPNGSELHGFIDGFPEVRRDFPSTREIGIWHEPESHFWAILRDDVPVAIVSIEGHVYRRNRRYDLAAEYAANGRRMLPLAARVLGDLLP